MFTRFFTFLLSSFAFLLFFSSLPAHSQLSDKVLTISSDEDAYNNTMHFPPSLLAQNEAPQTTIKRSIAPPNLNTKLNTSLLTTSHKPVIRVGYEEGFGIIANSTSYSNKGYGYDLLQKFGYFAGIEFEFVEIKGSLIEAVQEGIVDIAGLYSIDEKRKKQVAYGSLPLHFLLFSLATKGDQDIFYDDPKAIDKKTVATYKDNPGNAFLDNYLKENNISVEYVYGDMSNYEELETDYYLLPSDMRVAGEFHTVINLELRHLYLFTRLGNEELMQYLDRQLYEFFIENVTLPDILAQRYKHFGNELQNRSLTREEAAKLSGKTFRVGYTDNHAPYQAQTLTGEPDGIAVDFMNTLAEEYNFNVEYIPYNLEASWSGFEDLDILISLLGERNHISRFYVGTDSYTSIDMNIIFQENFLKDEHASQENQFGLPKNSKIALLNYINFRYSDFFNDYPNIQIVHYTNTNDLLSAFVDDEVEALIATDVGTNSIAALATQKKLQTSLNLPLNLNFQISKKISDEYLQLFNIIINKESENTIKAITANKVSAYMPTFGSEQFIKTNMNFILAAALLLLTLISSFAIVLRQRSAISVLAKDDITPLKSVSQFTKEVDSLLQKADSNEYEMITLDIDYFRMINSYYGNDKGTEVIKAMAQGLLDAYKNTNTLLCRRVAEQFLIFKKINIGQEIEDVVYKYVVPQIKTIVGENYSLKMSIASCKNNEKSESMNDLLDNIIIAHQEAKKAHSISFVEFNEEMSQKTSTMLNIIYRMEHALQNKEFKVHYQPKIDFKSLKIMGAEALIRWIPPIGNPVYPSDFIPVMEKNGFISQLEIYVFEEVCLFIQQNKDKIKNAKIAINISPISLSKAAFIKQMVEILKQYKISPSQLEIEITESALGDFEEVLSKIITVLHKIGFSVAMDDFGAGNSSLNRLSVIEVDVLKLDKVFLDFHEDAPRGSLVVQQIIMLAKQLGMKIVAEGIEQGSQARWLKEIECDIAQGYYFAKPLNENDFAQLVQENKEYFIS